MTNLNSEIQKYIWKDFTKHKLIAVPTISFIIFFSLLNNWQNSQELTLGITSFISFSIIFIYASYAAMNSIFEELNDGTWDYQRLSPISPLNLTFGKLFGSTLFAYYIGFFALLTQYYFLAITSQNQFESFIKILLTLLCAIFCNALSLFIATLSLQEKTKNKKIASSLAYFLCLLFSSSIYLSINNNDIVTWYKLNFKSSIFLAFSVSFFLIWTLFGIYRTLKQNLMYRVTPLAWTSFVVFIIIYISGFEINFINNEIFEHIIITSFTISVLMTYISIFSEKINITKFKIFLNSIKSKNLITTLQTTAKWLPVFFITLILMVISLISFSKTYKEIFLIVGIIIFLLRDISIIYFFRFANKNNKSGFAILFYLIVLYVVLPIFFFAINLKSVALIFFPIPVEEFNKTLINSSFWLLQLFLAAFLSITRFHKLSK
jgi:hypothetical protein